MVREGDGTASPLALADAEVLVEGLSALNAGSVGADDLVDVISAAVAGHGAQLRTGRTRVVGSVGLDDIVLNEGARGPAVESEQRVATGVEAASVCDGAICCWYPGLSVLFLMIRMSGPTERFQSTSQYH